MTVSSTAANGTTTGGANQSGSSSLLNGVNFDTFLTLLVAQLKYQDPLNPTDSTQFTGQLAQFSQVEQQINSNNYLSELLKQRDYGQQTLATSYLGKVILGPGNTVAKSGDVTEFGYSLDKASAKAEVQVFDKDGKLVYTFDGDTEAGNHIVTWDGTDATGTALPDGNYTIKVNATDGDGNKITATTLTYGKVASVMNSAGQAMLIMTDGRQIDIDDVLAVTSLGTAPTDTGDNSDTSTGDNGTGNDADNQG
jgi:flagellar basal-body rod modification protein FlgD